MRHVTETEKKKPHTHTDKNILTAGLQNDCRDKRKEMEG